MKIYPDDFRVPPGKKVDLKKWPTEVKPVYDSKNAYHHRLQSQAEELSELQQLQYASNRYAVLLIFQAMDAAGKDGAIHHVMSGVNPQGCQVFSFKHPVEPKGAGRYLLLLGRNFGQALRETPQIGPHGGLAGWHESGNI